jgi:ATP-dependent Clp protease ATP-binding subunit ClpX
VLLNVMYEMPGRTDVAKVLVEADAVLGTGTPTVVPRSGRASRQRRAAS